MPLSGPPIVALEIGTTMVRSMVADVRDDGHLMIVGLGECPSRGIRKSEIFDFDTALSCVKTALHRAEESSGVMIGQVHLLVSGGHIQSQINRGSVPIEGPEGEITREDIDHVMNAARAMSLASDREVLHSICQHFYVDDQDGVINPQGMSGAKIALDMLILHGVRNRIVNMVRLTRSAGVDVQDVAFSGLCSALAVLSPEDKESGALVIDLGGGTTNFVVYAENAIAAAGCLAVGGDHITYDVARGLKIPFAYAERLKEEAGSAVIDHATRTHKLELPSDGGAGGRFVRRGDLHTITSLRVEEILSMVRAQVSAGDTLHHLGAGVVLTGGGAYLKNMAPLVEKVLGLPCQMGHPQDVSGMAVTTEGPEYAAPLGMLRYAARTGKKGAASLGDLIRKIFSRA